jgi:hypothetical protein
MFSVLRLYVGRCDVIFYDFMSVLEKIFCRPDVWTIFFFFEFMLVLKMNLCRREVMSFFLFFRRWPKMTSKMNFCRPIALSFFWHFILPKNIFLFFYDFSSVVQNEFRSARLYVIFYDFPSILKITLCRPT